MSWATLYFMSWGEWTIKATLAIIIKNSCIFFSRLLKNLQLKQTTKGELPLDMAISNNTISTTPTLSRKSLIKLMQLY